MLELNHRIRRGLPVLGLAIVTMTWPARGSLVGHWQFEQGSGIDAVPGPAQSCVAGDHYTGLGGGEGGGSGSLPPACRCHYPC